MNYYLLSVVRLVILLLFNIVIIFVDFQLSSATLVAIDDLTFGEHSIIYDTNTELEWLVPIKSISMSYLDIKNDYLGNGIFNNFRHATVSEIKNLLTSYLGPNIVFFQEIVNLSDYLEIIKFFNTFGPATSYTSTLERISGYCIDDEGQDVYTVSIEYFNVVVDDNGPPKTFTYSDFKMLRAVPDWRTVYIGNWLVKDHNSGTTPVPEPSTILLFAAGLAGLTAIGRRRKA